MERPSPAYLLRAAGIDENTYIEIVGVEDPTNIFTYYHRQL